jgi:predicted TIM-barrel fold metal-dependent hydrolase
MQASADKPNQPASKPRPVERIDVHAHFLPAFYRQALIDAGESQPDGIASLPQWDEKTTLRVMDDLGIQTALLSISSPGVHFGDDARALDLARRCNDEGARLQTAYPGRFGHFACLPLPDVEGSIKEAARALDQLSADGVILETNHRGIYLGDPQLDPLYAELNRREAVIFVHPTSPACSCCSRLSASYPQPMVEFMFETTRSIADMVLSGVLERYPRLKVIVPHAGAALPALSERIELLLPMLGKEGAPKPPSLREALRKLHFDLAGAPVPHLLEVLLSVADPHRLHYGSDYPFTPAHVCDMLAQKIENTPALTDELRQRIWSDNARELFPRLSGSAVPSQAV